MNTLKTEHTRQLNNWSQAVGNYIQQRRQQTKHAYTGKADDSKADGSKADNSDLNDSEAKAFLFQSLLIILGQELEAGHTVIELMATDNWQNTLLLKLLKPWQGLVDISDVAYNPDEVGVDGTGGIDGLDKIDGLNEQAFIDHCLSTKTDIHLASAQLDKNSKNLLLQRQQLAVQLSQFIKNRTLFEFAQALARHELFSSITDSADGHNQRINSPLVFSCRDNLGNLDKPSSDGTLQLSNSKLVLWLHRSWFAEWSIANHIKRINENTPTALPIDEYLADTLKPMQKQAIATANQHAFSIITGGPGTGKTYTVAQLVMALHQAHHHQTTAEASAKPLSLALSAPTGKAAQRMQESLQSAISQSGVDIQLQQAKTIHRLLGIGATGTPRYNANNPLSEDIIIVDEASMLGVELAYYLLSAVKSGARLILLGDAHQLAAVDAGAVLADLCRLPVLQHNHCQLVESSRFDDKSGVGKLAKLINNNQIADDDKIAKLNQLLTAEQQLAFYPLSNSSLSGVQEGKPKQSDYQLLEAEYAQYFEQSKRVLDDIKQTHCSPDELMSKAKALLATFNQFRILTAGHNGSLGDIELNMRLASKHKTLLKLPLSSSDWYHARPIMISKNNYQQGLYNGDIGLCLHTKEGFKLYFEHKSTLVPVDMLNESELTTAYAMTIHKSQGSEFNHVAVMLDEAGKRLLSRELIYTAVTRAKDKVSIVSSPSSLTRAVITPTVRQTGLELQFG